ncbi:hypothetical protein IQ270_25960 [Microcoleus sp. LEGE 07076]|uniref:hypothetical protein n=1 Tax=Microcoleus sp. LEGE 07076 TaxID=915322 RepID=UPI0018830565|nr:hypothetical protein [Microcoleus sp. LEGE 07076]MBE9187993.1 hypothetical protein [Microcoleus sp. LEGE 07076]
MIEFVVIVESSADARTATKLADRILVQKIDWLEPEMLQHLYQWSGLEAETDNSCWKNIDDITKRLADKFKFPTIRSNGKFKSDGQSANKIIKLISFIQYKQKREIKAVIFMRDLDNQPERKKHIDQVRSEHINQQPKLAIIIGTANKMREAWVLNGFIPFNREEEQLLQEITTQLTFNPCNESHKLRSNSLTEPDRMRNPKAVVEKLTGGQMEREQQCWEETNLEHLREKGVQTGLTAYINEIEERLIPIIGSAE